MTEQPVGPLPEGRADGRAEVVTICGSTKFKTEILAEVARLTLDGVLVISLGVFGHTDLPGYDWTTDGNDLKRMLDELHKRKIDLADRVHVVNPGGYYGDSTRGEIEYARSQGKPVTFMSDLAAPVVAVPEAGAASLALRDAADWLESQAAWGYAEKLRAMADEHAAPAVPVGVQPCSPEPHPPHASQVPGFAGCPGAPPVGVQPEPAEGPTCPATGHPCDLDCPADEAPGLCATPAVPVGVQPASETATSGCMYCPMPNGAHSMYCPRFVDGARCRHCGKQPDADGDHSCPCPNGDDCPDHPVGVQPEPAEEAEIERRWLAAAARDGQDLDEFVAEQSAVPVVHPEPGARVAIEAGWAAYQSRSLIGKTEREYVEAAVAAAVAAVRADQLAKVQALPGEMGYTNLLGRNKVLAIIQGEA